jgi:hypothetical protein
VLNLIRRELNDHLLYVLVPCVISIGLVWIAIYVMLWSAMAEVIVVTALIGIPALLIGYCGLGASQMYGDRVHRISTLLCTLAVTRNQVFAARVVVGTATVLATVVSLTIAAAVVPRLSERLVEFPSVWLVQTSMAIALAGFACYCMGLLVGWTTSRVWLLLGGMLLLALAMSLIVIKGFGIGAVAVLLLFIAASLGVAWHRFTSTSL